MKAKKNSVMPHRFPVGAINTTAPKKYKHDPNTYICPDNYRRFRGPFKATYHYNYTYQ